MKFVEIQNVSPKIPNQITCLCNGILAVDFCHTFEILIHYFVYKWTENSSKSHFHSNENGFYFSNSSSALYLHLNLKARFDWLSVRSCIWTHTSLWLRPIRKLYALNFSVAFVHFACSLLGYSNKKNATRQANAHKKTCASLSTYSADIPTLFCNLFIIMLFNTFCLK